MSGWVQFLIKLPAVIGGIVGIIDKVKASGADKKAAVLAALPESVALAEFISGRDLLNDPAIQPAIDAVIEAEVALLKARNALKAVLLAKKPPNG